MFVTAVRQPVTFTVRGKGMHPEAMGVNVPNICQGESLLEGCQFESWTLSWRYGKEQFIILASGQREVHRIEVARCCIGAAGRR